MCSNTRVKSLNDDTVKSYSEAKAMGLGYDTLPKKDSPNYQNEVNRRKLSFRNLRIKNGGQLRIPTQNLQQGSGVQL